MNDSALDGSAVLASERKFTVKEINGFEVKPANFSLSGCASNPVMSWTARVCLTDSVPREGTSRCRTVRSGLLPPVQRTDEAGQSRLSPDGNPDLFAIIPRASTGLRDWRVFSVSFVDLNAFGSLHNERRNAASVPSELQDRIARARHIDQDERSKQTWQTK
jgi:hypothetical protein